METRLNRSTFVTLAASMAIGVTAVTNAQIFQHQIFATKPTFACYYLQSSNHTWTYVLKNGGTTLFTNSTFNPWTGSNNPVGSYNFPTGMATDLTGYLYETLTDNAGSFGPYSNRVYPVGPDSMGFTLMQQGVITSGTASWVFQSPPSGYTLWLYVGGSTTSVGSCGLSASCSIGSLGQGVYDFCIAANGSAPNLGDPATLAYKDAHHIAIPYN